MNTKTNFVKSCRSALALAIAASFVATATERTAHADPIVFGTPVTVLAAATDVFNQGAMQYGYALSNTATTVNGVPFSAGNSATALGTNITLTGFDSGVNNTALGTGSGSTWATLPAAYQTLLRGATFTAGATSTTVTLNNLTVGRNYVTQVWVNDNRVAPTATRTETVTGFNTVTLDYNSTNGNGGVGQSTLGLFQAGATTQSFSMLGSAGSGTPSTQLNAIQVRDVTNIGFWTGVGGATWSGAGITNFATNYSTAALASANYDTARAVLGAVTFSDTYWDNGVEVAVTNNNITLGSGITAGNFRFQNNSLNYTVTNSTGNVLGGTGTLFKSGTGTLTLAGTVANTFTGGTVINDGVIAVTNPLALAGNGVGTGRITINASGTPLTGNFSLQAASRPTSAQIIVWSSITTSRCPAISPSSTPAAVAASTASVSVVREH